MKRKKRYREDEILGMIGRATTRGRRKTAFLWLLSHQSDIEPEVFKSAAVRLIGLQEARKRGIVK